MTLLQRTPREVYRVFDEDEFLVRGAHEHRTVPAAPAAVQPCLRRIAGTTALVAATGAVGGLLAMAGVFSGSGTRRRTGVRLLASTGSSGALPSSSSHVAAARVLRRLTVSEASRDAVARERPKRVRVSRRPRLDVRLMVERRVASVASASRKVALASVTAPRSTSVEAVPSGGRAPATVGSSRPLRSGRSEFGFER